MSEKLTPEWCEAQAADIDGFALDPSTSRDDSERAKLISEACRLAARALKAREWAEANAIPGEHVTNEFQNGTACAAGVILAILDGRTP